MSLGITKQLRWIFVPHPIVPRCPIINLDDVLPDAMVGDIYNSVITATGGLAPYVFSLIDGALPPGLTLNSDGTITGVVA